MTIGEQIIQIASKKEKGKAFCVDDFLGAGDYRSVDKALERMVAKGTVKRAIPGIYYFPNYNRELGMEVPPDLESVAEAIARNFGWNILPSGNSALLALGLSAQVPASLLYISDGRYKKYDVLGTMVEFKKASSSKFRAQKKNGIVFQALKAIGNGRVTDMEINKIRMFYRDGKDKIQLIKDLRYAPRWMHKYLYKIGEDSDV